MPPRDDWYGLFESHCTPKPFVYINRVTEIISGSYVWHLLYRGISKKEYPETIC